MNTTAFDFDLRIPVSSSDPQLNPRKKRSKSTQPEQSSGVVFSQPKYGKRPDPGAPKITRPCSECGKKFWSWKALFGHMRCHPERQWRGINPPPNIRPISAPDDSAPMIVGNYTEDHQIAECLLLLANGTHPSRIDHGGASTSYDECLFECSSCKKVFRSHQALGGHRASHKNVKGCFAITRSNTTSTTSTEAEEDQTTLFGEKRHQDQYKCGICLKGFGSGQALGGHMKFHWDDDHQPWSMTSGQTGLKEQGFSSTSNGLDLNLPRLAMDLDDDDCYYSTSNSFSPNSGQAYLDLRLGL